MNRRPSVPPIDDHVTERDYQPPHLDTFTVSDDNHRAFFCAWCATHPYSYDGAVRDFSEAVRMGMVL